ncbi:MAG: hypothetical protein JNL98_40445 [Bryobacterales bacterium]|nr:hypothetical protein [Bryobacterales bacterium]
MAAKGTALPFVAKYGLGMRLFALVMLALMLWIVLGAEGADGRPTVVHVWEQGGIVKKLGVILIFLMTPVLPFDVFRVRTVFTENEIRHLPMFGRWRIFRYQDIVEIETYPGEFARIRFRDGRKLKIWAMRADPRVIEEIVRSGASKPSIGRDA